jgi:CheY-like chemotaxis protein/signal transduction histidine kinase
VNPRILLVEDNRANRDLVRYLLESQGFTCDEAVDGESGIEMARRHRPDLVICDLHLPGIDGFEVLRSIRADPGLAGVVVVAVTAYAMVGDRERILASGFDGYIPKPIDPLRFIGQVMACLGRTPAPGRNVAEPAKGARILVVDDRALNRELLVSVLGHFGHTVVQASDGADALAQLRADPADLVITDLLMPNMDGEDLCRQLRADPATQALPIIIHTASYRARQGRQVADRVGVKWVLPKPCDPADIVSMVSEALGIEVPALLLPAARVAVEAGVGGESNDPAQDDLAEMQLRNQRLTALLESALHIAASQSATLQAGGLALEAHSLNQRLTNLVSLGVQLSFERDPDGLADLVGSAAQDIMSARYIGVAVLAADGALQKFVSRGLDHATHDAVAAQMSDCAAARRLLGTGGEGRMIVAAKPGDFTGLPAAHPQVRNMIGCRIAARDLAFGWVYAADRLGDEGFTAADERLLLALGAYLASAWNGLRTIHELDRRVAERTRELEARNAQLDAFSALVSHDLRAPLDHIGGFVAALAARHGDTLPPEAARYVGKIGNAVGTMQTLIDDLLEFSRLSRTGLSLRSVALQALVDDCLGRFQDEIAQRQVQVRVTALPVCMADPAMLSQALFNMIGNALKYTGNQPLPVIEISSQTTGDDVVVSIRDNGAGFDPSFADRLFQPFQRLHSAQEFPGTGMGLAMVREVVTRHGGRVWAESQLGHGACFHFSLPA